MRLGQFLAAAVMLLAPAFGCLAQTAPEGFIYVDSLVYTPVSAVDSTLRGESVWESMPYGVTVRQSDSARQAVDAMTARNADKNWTGYRIRIFFDNRQNARSASEEAANRFRVMHPGIPAYRSFSYPFFKVTVGDYRTKSEALAALSYIKPDFPSAFIVKEKFKYPAVDNLHSVKVDTIRILKPLSQTNPNGQ